MLTKEQYDEHKARQARYDSWSTQYKKPSGWTVITAAEQTTCPADARITNDERSAIEVYEFVTNPPDNYFLYVNAKTREVTTWTGDKLGTYHMGCRFRDGFGGTRVSITVDAINGRRYHGTYFESSGDYARIKAFKR